MIQEPVYIDPIQQHVDVYPIQQRIDVYPIEQGVHIQSGNNKLDDTLRYQLGQRFSWRG